mgnify:CR=1 FL=1
MEENNKFKGCKSGFTITEEIKQKDKIKTRLLKFIIFKKRTENEVFNKFKDEYDNEILSEVIQQLKELKYIDDQEYIEKYVLDTLKLKTLSIKELKFKLQTKEIARNLIDKYFEKHYNELYQYEIQSAKKIFVKKSNKELQDIKNYLFRKGYLSETIRTAQDQFIEENNG